MWGDEDEYEEPEQGGDNIEEREEESKTTERAISKKEIEGIRTRSKGLA